MDRRRAGGAGVLDPGGALEPQFRQMLQHQRAGEILAREAGIEMAEHDLVDIPGMQAGIGDGGARHLADQGFHILAVMAAEGRMSPAHDASGHAPPPGRSKAACPILRGSAVGIQESHQLAGRFAQHLDRRA